MENKYQISTVGALIFNDKNEVFLMKSPKWKNKYICPGGKVEYGESMAEALKREVKEETNLDITDIEFICVMDAMDLSKEYEGEFEHYIFHDFKARALNPEEIKLDGNEGKKFKWLSPEEWLRKENIEKYTKIALEKLISQGEDYKGMYLRALADYQNLLKQSQKDRSEFAKYANEGLLNELIPVYDNLKLAVEHADEKSHDAWLQGVKFVIKQFKTALENSGIEEIKTIGEKYDHNTMEAMENIETNKKDMDQIVAKEIKPGYILNGKVIIAARVAVYKFK